ncbi:16104_t:CDS:2, partial [Gigaspora margarita]
TSIPKFSTDTVLTQAKGNEVQTFLNFHVEEDYPLFLPAENSNRPADSTRSKKHYVKDLTLQELLENEEACNKDKEDSFQKSVIEAKLLLRRVQNRS